jgi:branched-chain amino acid aminotransferase
MTQGSDYREAMPMTQCSRNGVLMPKEQATVSVDNVAYAYGFGVYETLRAVRGKAIFQDEHLARLQRSAELIGLEHPFDTATIGRWIEELLCTIESDACNLKMLLIGGHKKEDAVLWILPLAPLFTDRKQGRDGVRVITVRHERFLPQAKTLNMLPSYLAYRRAKEAGCLDALLINRNSCITEGTRTNILALRGNTIITPPAREILEGVMRAHVLHVAREQGMEVKEEAIPLERVQEYDGLCLTSTSTKILPISRVDDLIIKIPDTLRTLMEHVSRHLAEAGR